MSTEVITGTNPTECVHVACSGWDTCRYLPEPFGPELPDLILDSEGKWWGHRVPGGKLWWYGHEKAVTWLDLVRMASGAPPSDRDVAGDRLTNQFPWGRWIGSTYGDSAAAEATMRELVGA